MPLRLYNTASRTVEPFEPVRAGHVRMYVCGLTPSAESHLGHARSFLFFDVLRRYLRQQGYVVTYVQNVTDIDDRSIASARELGISWKDFVGSNYASFKHSMARLGVLEPDHEPYATDYIAPIINMIARLIERGHAYAAGDGVYYRVASFARYGALSGRKTEELLIGARIAAGEQKDDPLDFALWKFAKPDEPSWPSPWGAGRPGWHIECSAMSHELLGEPFDIHGGGFDLVFPHHENEIAQSEPLLDRPPMVRFWVHGGLLLFDERKMSKSLGNFEPLHAVLDRHDPQAIRYLFLQTGYRKPMNFTEASIESAATGMRRLFTAYDTLRTAGSTAPALEDRPSGAVIGVFTRRFFDALDDDMNTAGAVSVLFELANRAQTLVDEGAGVAAAAFLDEALDVLGIAPAQRATASLPAAHLDRTAVERLRALVGESVTLNGAAPQSAVEAVVAARNAARAAKDFALADRLRAALSEVGVTLKDGQGGTTWTVDR